MLLGTVEWFEVGLMEMEFSIVHMFCLVATPAEGENGQGSIIKLMVLVNKISTL